MTTEHDLLRAVARHPAEDTPRLAFADWLDEHGDPDRAAFVRGQIALAGMPADTPERRELAFRVRTLLDAHENEWISELRASLKCKGLGPTPPASGAGRGASCTRST